MENYKIHRQCPIHQIDAGLNLLRRELIAKRLLRNAEKYGVIPENNHGGRNDMMANDVVMLKFFTFGICHLQRRNCALTDCDAKACYDRILPILLYLCYGKMGLPSETCQWLCRALTSMEYHIVTSHGPSENVSKTDSRGTIYGIGQGATDAPSGWLFLSALISRVHDARANGCTLFNPKKDLKLNWSHVIFVDDAYLMHTASDKSSTPHELRRIIQSDTSSWQDGLHSSGGKLEFNKTNYFMLIWAFRGDGTPYLTEATDTNQNDSVVLNVEGTHVIMNQTSATHASSQFKSLGVRIPGDLRSQYEISAVVDKAKRFTRFLYSSPVTRDEAHIAYHQYLVPSYTYGALCMSPKIIDIAKIHATFLPTLLPKLGFQSTFPRAVVFAPISLGGIGITPYDTIILQHKLVFLYRHLRTVSTLSRAIILNLQWTQLQSGRQNPLFTTDDRIDYVENQWAVHLHNLLRLMKGKLVLTALNSGRIQREHDYFLMDMFDTHYSQSSLKKLNYCRLYLQVERLSDICTNDGKYIQMCYLLGTQRNLYNIKDWTQQGKTDKQIWGL